MLSVTADCAYTVNARKEAYISDSQRSDGIRTAFFTSMAADLENQMNALNFNDVSPYHTHDLYTYVVSDSLQCLAGRQPRR